VRALLRSFWDEARPPGARPPDWRDRALVGVLAVAAVLEGVLRDGVRWRVVTIVLSVGIIATLHWRRTHPLGATVAAFAPCGVVTVASGGDVPQLNVLVCMLLLPYALVRWGSGREIVIGSAVFLTCAGASIAVQFTNLADLVGASGVILAAYALGAAFRYRSGARSRELEQVKLLERERLARDLHDTVAHHVSAIAIRAQAGLATAPANPEAGTDALRIIEQEASRTLAEMRAMVRALRRDQPADLAPTPGLAEIEKLADGAHPPVDVEIDGDPDGVPPPVAAAVFRLAQESVTNARRHARNATRIEVRVAAGADDVRLRVSDDGDPASAGGRGYGLVGMAERAHLLGGTCEAGPGPGRGWTVTAVLPRAGWAT
jgi:signal transduction histidine kinase